MSLVTEELNLPADIPSYLSSQGTLSEPQEGYSNSEAGSHQQLMPPVSGFMHRGTDGKGSLFMFTTSPRPLGFMFPHVVSTLTLSNTLTVKYSM